MAGYSDTRQLIIDTLTGRPAGTEIQPEDHQAFALALNEYIRNVELNSGNAFIGVAQADTVPIQSNNGQCFYISTVPPGTNTIYTNFIDSSGDPISVTTPSDKMAFVTLIWDTRNWDAQITIIEIIDTKSMVSVTYEKLVELRDNGELVAGAQYRITNYITTTTQANTQSARHPFDVIVLALDENTLSERAWAIQSARDTDGYFANSKLSAWKIWYCLDNDTSRFAWAVSTSNGGKGVIYRMIDEHNNDCPYDFKNIQFRHPVNTTTDFNYYYTFSTVLSSGVVSDHSLRGGYCYGNKIGFRITYIKQQLNNIVFINTAETNLCYSNSFGKNCYSNTFGNSCYSNTFGNNCQFNAFGANCYSNSFGNYCDYNSFGDNCFYNSFGNYCNNNSFGANCDYNSFGDNCGHNESGNTCYYNSFGNYCGYNSFGHSCYSNTFGNSCYSNTFGNTCKNNSFSNSCYSNDFGDNCNNNSFDDNCYKNRFGNGSYGNSFKNNCHDNSLGIGCGYNSFGNSCKFNIFGESTDKIKSYYRYITFDNGNSYINLNCTSTTSSSKHYQNVRIGLGVNNTTTSKTINDSNVGQTYETLYKPADSKELTA